MQDAKNVYRKEFDAALHEYNARQARPHMHVVGVPVGRGFKRGLSTKVSKQSVFTPQSLSMEFYYN